ncbi:FAD binding domain protein [Colletotrichum scovillei]|nr:FAD binding domain protein [Colletotrichum scovillei]
MLATISSESKRAASQTAVSLLQSVLEERDKVFVRTGGNNSRKKHGLVEEIAQSAAAGIGTISEALHHRREKKSRALDPQRPSSHSGSISNTESTPIQLDEGTGKANTPDLGAATPMSTSPPSQNIHDLASAFIKRHPLKTTGSSEDGQRLSLPVLVPQRRPEKRARGFIRAYAPMLVDVKINQDTFLDFIDTLNKSLEPNPWISAREISDVAAGKKKPSEGWQELKTQMGDLMKPTRGDFKWPEPAPLIFPDVKSTPKKGDVEAKKKNAWDRMEDWINNHSDKRAQASWIDENKNHPRMNLMPQPKFKSRYADPNHQVSSGDLVSLVTGGRWRLATDTKDETSKRPERMADEKCDKEKGLRESSNKDEKKKKSTTKDRKKGILEADREKKDDGETGEITAYQERSLETVSLRSHTEEGGAEKDVGKDGVTNTKDICRVGEIEGGDRGMVRAKEAKKKAGSSSKSGDVFKGLFQKDVLYLAILELPSQGKAD